MDKEKTIIPQKTKLEYQIMIACQYSAIACERKHRRSMLTIEERLQFREKIICKIQ